MRSLTTSFISLSLLSGTVHAESIARVWTHFYPNCPGEAFSNLDTYEKYHVSGPSQNITQGSCKSFSVPSYEKNLVDAISVDAELPLQRPRPPFPLRRQRLQHHRTRGPGIEEIRDGVAISQCASRQFVAYSQVWVNLVCDSDSPLHNENIPAHGAKENNKQADTHQSIPTSQPDAPVRAEKHTTVEDIKNIQMPGSNSDSWRASQATHSQREPVQEGRVNQAGHAQSDQIVHHIMQLLKNKTSHIVTGKHHAHSNVTLHHNGTAPGNRTVMTRRRLSVLRNRAARLV
ncbi:hypothetical protein N7524_001929 [Penicillium chrysogenum]|nr:hypothetical protein N7524_001929 [Penicillium chrysogenum]